MVLYLKSNFCYALQILFLSVSSSICIGQEEHFKNVLTMGEKFAEKHHLPTVLVICPDLRQYKQEAGKCLRHTRKAMGENRRQNYLKAIYLKENDHTLFHGHEKGGQLNLAFPDIHMKETDTFYEHDSLIYWLIHVIDKQGK